MSVSRLVWWASSLISSSFSSCSSLLLTLLESRCCSQWNVLVEWKSLNFTIVKELSESHGSFYYSMWVFFSGPPVLTICLHQEEPSNLISLARNSNGSMHITLSKNQWNPKPHTTILMCEVWLFNNQKYFYNGLWQNPNKLHSQNSVLDYTHQLKEEHRLYQDDQKPADIWVKRGADSSSQQNNMRLMIIILERWRQGRVKKEDHCDYQDWQHTT